MHIYFRGSSLQRLRLASGLTLMAFAATHFANHAVGLVSLEAMHRVQELRTAITRSWPVSLILLLALTAHVALGLYKLSRRETWRMPLWEALQIGIGLSIPFLLFPHIVNTRVAHAVFGADDIYLYELVRLWPDSALLQSTLLVLVWLHGCIGIHYWLRLSDSYSRFAPFLLAVALFLPVLALSGFAVAGMRATYIMSDPGAFAALKARTNWPNADDAAAMATLRDIVRWGFGLLAAAVIGIAFLRYRREAAKRGPARISYLDGPAVELTPGMTLLEISRSAGIPHASLCGGRGRCSTCRVRIEKGLESLPVPDAVEATTLSAIDAPSNVRLACQIRPTAALTVAVVSRPGVHRPIHAEFSEIKEVVAAHIRADIGGSAIEFASSDPAEVEAWLLRHSEYAAKVRDVERWGYRLRGARMDYVGERTVGACVYERDTRLISIFMFPETDSSPVAICGQRNRYSALSWRDETGTICCSVSQVTVEVLEHLAEAWEEAAAAPADSGDPVNLEATRHCDE
jgi:adenylate cyclase